MNNDLHTHSTTRRILSLVLIAQLALAPVLHAAPVALATAPLANATTTTVLPNLLFIMDNSGSMSQEYTPDWVSEYSLRVTPWTYDGSWNAPATNQKNCRDSADDEGTIQTGLTNMDMCVVGDVPFMNSAINSQYYNPEIRYLPGAKADGSSYPSQTDPTAVLLDGYGKHNMTQLGVAGVAGSTINLTTDYPDRVWCTTNTPAAGDITGATTTSANCRINSDYLYPDATYKYGRDNDGTVAYKNVLGKYGAPYYYSTVVSEYCSEAELRNCVTSGTATGIYTFPAKARYCSDTNLTLCQSIKTSVYKYPRYPGTSVTAVAAVGSLTLNARTAGLGTAGRNVSSITTGTPAVEILGATISGAAGMSSNTLATNIATQINTYNSNPEFTAVAVGDVITITSTAGAGATANGTVSYTHAGSAIASKVNTAGGVTGVNSVGYTFARTDITAPVAPAVGSYPKGTARTDCVTFTAPATAATTCTYAEEITNFGNWYAYYRTRMQSMKSAVSIAFKPIGSTYRVGFINICKGDYLPIAQFDNSTAAVPAVAATGYITVGGTSQNKSFSSIMVNGVEILGATVSWGNSENDAGLAALLAAQINSYVSDPEYTAVINGSNPKRIDLTSTTSAGAGANGNVTYTSTGTTLATQSGTHIKGGVTAIGQKTYWYDKLHNSTAAGCGTPLRSALATAGRIFGGVELSTAGDTSGTTIDPIQYACQKNFSLLTTDGYWNSDSAASIKDLAGNPMGNLDGGTTSRPQFEGPTASSGSLADVARYYYDTDLRTTTCTGGLGGSINVCSEGLFTKQKMTSYTLGLGVDGTLAYVSDYNNTTSGDFYNLKNGLLSTNWPVPAGDTETAVDDLWHAAVNGGGTYFSAKDPAQLATGLNSALAAINADAGAASAAATSTLNPVAGNNYAYLASYTTGKWRGNLEARTINVVSGAVSDTASWCVESIAAGSCSAPSSVVADGSNSSVIYNCVTPSSTLASCPSPGILDGTDCKVEMTNACTGTMPAKVATASDTRTIYKSDGATPPVLQSFTYANLNAADFAGTGLSQWSVLTASQKTAAAGANLVNFLRGQTGYEDRTSNTATDRLYRFREATLGDALESQPSFISKPVFSYADPGYFDYKTAQASRAGTVYLGANDGMMHAFASTDGVERWAYVPTAVIPDMWRLADKNYATGHHNFVNGSPIISDICTANCACDAACVTGGGLAPVWKTILVAGLNAGGRSFYALDITDPATPTLLWEITSATTGFSNLGYSYGQPVITKKSDGSWVALLTSGYNNTSPGDGVGYLYVVDAYAGTKLSEISTAAGDTTTPSGFARIAAWNDFAGTNNTAGYVYGGDLLGNLWRFDINAGTKILFSTLKDSLGNAQPITTTPTLGQINSQRVVFVGTGKYLEVNDLTNTASQTIYGIRDDNTGITLANARTALVKQTLTESGDTRTASSNAVNFSTGRGWYVDLGEIVAPATTTLGERVNIDMQLVNGVLVAASIVPKNEICSPGGYGWLNFFNYETGGYFGATTLASTKYDAPIVGFNMLYINGQPFVVVTKATGGVTDDHSKDMGGAATGFQKKRIIWRELVQ